MSQSALRSASTLLLAASGAVALIAAGAANVDAQPFPGCPGSGGSGMEWSSSSSTAVGPSGWSPYGWLSPGGLCPDEESGLDDGCWPDGWSNPCRGLFGDTALSLSNSSRFGVRDFSIVQMPRMIQPPPAEGWEPNPQGAASSGPRVEAPQPVPTKSRVRAPLEARIAPERPAAEPEVSGA